MNTLSSSDGPRLLQMYMDLVTAACGSLGLKRIEQMLQIFCGLKEPAYPNDLHQPKLLFFPGLCSRNWYEPDEFNWSKEFEAQADLVLQEWREVMSKGISQPYLKPFDELLHFGTTAARQDLKDHGMHVASDDDAGWTSFFLYRHGSWIEANAKLCPNIRRLLSSTKLGPGEALFSVLEPNSFIPPHSGGCNMVLTCHLALVVPDSCGIRVGLDSRHWEEKKLMIFDDSYLHLAWNNSKSRRVVLIWDIWHPDLTEVELRALSLLFDRIVNNPDPQLS